MDKKQVILAIDPGSAKSGIAILVEDEIEKGDSDMNNEDLFSLIDNYAMFRQDVRLLVVYEDIRPYTSRFNMETIDTCKMIGRLEYTLKQLRVPFKGVTRNEVKSFVFNNYGAVAIPEIQKKIAKKGKLSKKGVPLKPSFQYVDDRIVRQAMKVHWKIETPKPGRSNSKGIKTHVWNALGVVSWYFNMESTIGKGTF